MKREYAIAGILLAFFLISCIFYALTNSITSDELTHITAGYINIHFNDYRFNVEHPPFIKQLAAIPLLFIKVNFPLSVYHASNVPDDIVTIQDAFLFRSGNDLDLILLLSRIPNILIALLLGIFIYIYSRRLNGSAAGLISLALFVLSPSFLGHSPLVTMDVAISCFYFMTIYFLMMFIETEHNRFLTLTGIFCGIALISKFSALIIIPIAYVLVALSAFSRREDIHYGKFRNYMFLIPLLPLACSYKSSFKFIAPALFVFLFLCFFFRKSLISRKIKWVCIVLLVVLTIAFTIVIMDYTNFKWFPFGSATKAYFKGFSSFEGHARGGQSIAYLLGGSSGKGWWYYFPLAILFKEPASFLIILLFGLAALLIKKEKPLLKYFLVIPVLAYLFVSMFLNKVNIGIRHILPIYPFLYVIAGYSVVLARRFRYIFYLMCILLVFLAFDVLSSYPSHLSYFNKLIEWKSSGYKFLGDSNVAWGQDWKRLKEYVENNGIKEVKVAAFFTSNNNCAYYKIPFKDLKEEERICPAAGYYVLDAATLASRKIAWADKIKPSSHIGGSLLLYYITPKDAENCRNGTGQ